jgi:hypothetical protein
MIMIEKKYEFSFTASSLRVSEMIQFAKLYLTDNEIDIGLTKESTNKRMISEFKKRVDSLTISQQKLLIESDYLTQKQLLFLSVCKSYGLIRDFMVEVVRENYLLMNYHISDYEFSSFLRRKEVQHDELNEISENTKSKVKQVLFKILEQGGIIDTVKDREIQLQILFPSLIEVIVRDNPEWLKVFLYSDRDIQNMIQTNG